MALMFACTKVRDYAELAKLRLVSLVLLSTAVGFVLAPGSTDYGLMTACLAGTGLVAAGSMAFNQWWERREDARMNRTLGRPLPAGRMRTAEAFLFGSAISLAGLWILENYAGRPAAFLAGLTLITYILVYTPMKRSTSLCTIVGAVPGALPPLIGWAAAAGKTPAEAWLLFAIMFLWQMPHFLAIAWMYRRDYAAAGFRMLSVDNPDGEQVGRQIFLYALALLPASLLPTLAGINGPVYFAGALVLGTGFAALGFLCLSRLDEKAPAMFRASILYLALLLILMVVDRA